MIRKYLQLFGLILLFLIAGCAAPRTTAVLPEPRPLVKDYDSYAAPSPTTSADTVSYEKENPAGVITLPQALLLALKQNPRLAAFSYDIRAAEARALQAGLYPNPEASIELENFAGGGDLSGFQGTETAIALNQTFLLGGKRGKATRAAALEGDLAAWDYESARLDVFTEVRRTFLNVLEAQERIQLDENLVQLSQQLLTTIRQRVKAGKISPAEISRAQVRLSTRQVELERARRELQSARQQLAAAWGSRSAAFGQAAGALDTLFSVPEMDKLQNLLIRNPDLARFETALEQRRAIIALEDARKIPDPTLSGGVKRINELDVNAFVASLSIPLPFSDRNQGARQEARVRLSQTLWEKQAVEVQLNAALFSAYSNLQSAHSEASALKEKILPRAQEAFDTINEGYLQGRFNFIDVLDAQHTLFEARGQYLRALSDFHTAVAEIERLIGQDINSH